MHSCCTRVPNADRKGESFWHNASRITMTEVGGSRPLGDALWHGLDSSYSTLRISSSAGE
jgi:hypothetical protein